MITEVKTAPAEEPVTLTEAKTHLRVEHDLENDLISTLIQTAREYIEQKCNRILVTTSFYGYLDCFPAAQIEFCLSPVTEVVGISYTDDNGNPKTLLSSEYKIDLVSRRARIAPAYGKTFPTARQELNSVRIEFTAGYGNSAAVPAKFKQAILLLVGELYQNRENRVKKLPTTVIDLLFTELDFSF